MLVSVVNLKCSNCGESLTESMAKCPSCDQAVVIKKVSSLLGLPSAELHSRSRLMDREIMGGQNGNLVSDADFTAGCCFLRLKMFDQAIVRLGRAVDSDPCNVNALFCMAIAALKGKKAFLVPLADIRKVQEYLDAAMLVDERGIFRYFLAYIKQDFYARRFLKVEPSWHDEMQIALSLGVGQEERDELFNLLGVSCPVELSVR